MSSYEQRPDSRRNRTRRDTSAGLPDHHNPLRGVGGAAPALSALRLRLVLAGVGGVFAIVGAIAVGSVGAPWWIVLILVLVAVSAVVDIAVIMRRLRRGEPG